MLDVGEQRRLASHQPAGGGKTLVPAGVETGGRLGQRLVQLVEDGAGQLAPTSNYFATMLPAMLAGGIGTGLTFVGCTVVGMRAVAPTDSGIAAGLLNTSVQIGGAIGLAALAAIASTVTSGRLPGHTVAAVLTDGYVAGLLAGCAIYAVGAVTALVTINTRVSAAETAQH